MGVLAILLALWIGWGVAKSDATSSVLSLGANECATGQTCLPSLELTGAMSGVTNTLQIDAGSTNITGALSITGASVLTGSLSVSGASVFSTFTQGGGVTASSSVNATETLLSTDFDTENIIDYTFNGAAAGGTLKLPASTTVPLSTAVGSMRTIWIRNATTTAATSIIVTGNTGVLFKVASSTNQIGGGAGAQQIYGDTDGNNMGRIDLTRKANSDIIATFIFFRDN